jgi:putative ABC transport system permease protein
LSNGVTIVGIGVVAGLLVAFGATRYLGTLVYGVRPGDPLTLGAAAVVLTVVALLAHWLPVRRALRIDPATALRAE